MMTRHATEAERRAPDVRRQVIAANGRAYDKPLPAFVQNWFAVSMLETDLGQAQG
jgi:hypothetical protein